MVSNAARIIAARTLRLRDPCIITAPLVLIRGLSPRSSGRSLDIRRRLRPAEAFYEFPADVGYKMIVCGPGAGEFCGKGARTVEPDRLAPESCETGLEQLMIGYQQADAAATAALIGRLSPRLYRFFAGDMGNRTDADDMLQELWLRIHRVRHTYRPGEPLLPWAYAIARRVRIDAYRRRRRTSREVGVSVLPESAARQERETGAPAFDELVAALPESQREVLMMLKVDGLSVDEIARATSSTAGAVKQKAHRAYERLRSFLQGRASA
jgi:RNA polymerase sigma-70 factor (ECF subfamily)